MTFQASATVRNGTLDSIETSIGVSPLLRFYTGAAPANCAAAATGTLIGTITLPSDWMANASGGSKAMLGTWAGTAVASGMAGYWRIYDSGGTTCHFQGPVGQNWVASTTYALNQQVVNNSNVYKCTTAGTSAGSGGPSGTGSGITDNTAVWAYVDSALGVMTVDNDNFSSGQTFSTTGFTITAGNA
jgi:hypothetical protein